MRTITTYLVLFLLGITNVTAKELTLLIQPILDAKRTITLYAPLAEYLSKQTKTKIRIVATENFLAYWNLMRQTRHDLVLDAAHFTDYRVKQHNYEILAKIKDTVTYSLITNEEDVFFDEQELIAKRIATVSSPSLGGIHLEQLYNNPARLPQLVNTPTFNKALEILKSRQADAAMVPTPLINGDVSVNTILVTKPTPHMAISASLRVSRSIKQKIKKALLDTKNVPGGEEMRQSMNIAGFERARNTTYDGYSVLLTGVWGYRHK